MTTENIQLDDQHHLLIIDDDNTLRGFLQEYFSSTGWQVTEACNGAEGIKLFRQDVHHVILLDLMMPVMNGFEVLDFMRHNFPQTPIVILSGEQAVDDAVKALRAGAWDFFSKPVKDLYLLEFTLDEALEKARISHQREEYKTLLEEALRERTSSIRIMNSCFRDMISNQDESGILQSVRRSLLEEGDFAEVRIGIYFKENHDDLFWYSSRSPELLPTGGETASVEIRQHHIMLGILEATKRKGQLFTSQEHRLLQQLADIMAFAIHDLRQEYRMSLNEANLVDSQKRLELFFDSASEGIIFCEGEIITDVNREFCLQFGYSAIELIGESMAPLFDEATVLGSDSILQSLAENAVEIQGFRKDGTSFPVELRGSDLPNEEGLRVLTTRDLTQSKERDGRLIQARKMEAVGRLTSGISHDFNNLLTVIIGNLRLLQLDLAEGKHDVEEMTDDILSAAEDAAHLTKQLLSFSRQQPLETRVIDVGQLLKSLEGFFRAAAGSLTLELDIPDEPLHIRIDEKFLQSSLLNLILNAKDAMHDGGTLTISLQELVRRKDNSGELEVFASLTVADTGTGIDESIREKILEPFFTTKNENSNVGLGLSMTYSFVQQMGGELVIDSKKDQGTRISLIFPLGKTRHPDIVPTQDETLPVFVGTALVAEDDRMVRKLARRMLERLGFEVLEVENGDQALKILGQTEEIDLLFSDIIMPGSLQGDALAKQVSMLYPAVKIVLTTGNSSIFRGDRPIPNHPLITKPYSAAKLAKAIIRATTE